MTTKGITTHKPVTGKDGKVRLVERPGPASVSRKIAQRKSTKRTVVSPAKAGRVK